MALQSVIAAQGRPWNIRLVNLQEVLDPLDVFRKITRRRLQDLYNLVLARNWTLGSVLLLRGMHLVIRLYHPPQVRLLTRYWTEQRPDFVVSLVPNFNRALFESLRAALPSVPFATVLTDLADYPPHFWMEKQPDQFFVCGSRFAYEQAAKLGHPESRTFLTSGMIVRPEFYEEQPSGRAAGRQKLGLDPSLPTGLVMFGGEGSNAMKTIARRLGNSKRDLQLILVCGRNERLKRKLKSLPTRNRLAVVGFTRHIPCLMSLSSSLLGSPAREAWPEAIQMRLPVIVEQNAWTLPQETRTTRLGDRAGRRHGPQIVPICRCGCHPVSRTRAAPLHEGGSRTHQ